MPKRNAGGWQRGSRSRRCIPRSEVPHSLYRRRFAKLGDVQIPIVAREPVRYLEIPEDVPAHGAAASSRNRATKSRRRL